MVKTAYTSGLRSSCVGWMKTSPERRGGEESITRASTIKSHLSSTAVAHSAHRSASPLRPPRSPSRSAEPSGTSSSGSPGIFALLHHSRQGGNEVRARHHQLHTPPSTLAGTFAIAMKNDSGKSSNGKTDVKGNIKRLKVTGGLAALRCPRCLLRILTCIFNVFYPPDTLGPPGPGCWGSRRCSTPGSSHGRRSKVCHRFSRRCRESAGSARKRALRGPEAHQQRRGF